MGTIRAVDMVRHIRDEYYNLVKNMSFEQRKEFYHKKAEIVNSRASALLQKYQKGGVVSNDIPQ